MLFLNLALVFHHFSRRFCLHFTLLKMRNWHEIDFLIKHFMGRFSSFHPFGKSSLKYGYKRSRITVKLWKRNMAGRFLESSISSTAVPVTSALKFSVRRFKLSPTSRESNCRCWTCNSEISWTVQLTLTDGQSTTGTMLAKCSVNVKIRMKRQACDTRFSSSHSGKSSTS